MSPITVTITIIAYFIILFTVSWLAGRKTDNQGFFLGEENSLGFSWP